MSDEQQCEQFECTEMLQCDDVCVRTDQICDGLDSCTDGKDEVTCDVSKCPVDCSCMYDEDGLDIECKRGWLRSMEGVADLPATTHELTVKVENEFLKPGVFKTLQRLKKLNLLIGDHTGITEIPSMTFDRLEQLTFLNVTNVKFDILPDNIFEELTSLKVLMLWDSKNIEFEDGVFNGLQNLDTLVIVKGDPLIERNSYLRKSHLDSLPNLNTIYVDDPMMCCDVEKPVACINLKATYSISECGHLLGTTTFKSITFLLGLSAIIENIMVIALYVFFRYFSSANIPQVQSFLLTNLATANFLTGLYLIIIAGKDAAVGDAYQTISRTWQSSSTCRAAGFLAFLSSQASLILLLLLGIDRIMSLFAPLQKRRLNTRSAHGSSVFVWCFCTILSIIFISLAGPEDNNDFGLSDVCFSLPYFVEPFGYSVSIANQTETSMEFYLPVFNPYHTPSWNFIATFFFGLNFICTIIVVVIWIGITYGAIKKYRDNLVKYSDEMKLCIRLAPMTIINVVCWLVVILIGMWSHNTGNLVSNNMHSWSVLFIMPLSASLNPILYAVTIYFTGLETKDAANPHVDEQFTSEHGLVNTPQTNLVPDDVNIELNMQNEREASYVQDGACSQPEAIYAVVVRKSQHENGFDNLKEGSACGGKENIYT
ncbi:uncharacterized protein [Amphiura filiformis]|uniref:uncharacterized protein n=1 Tax=Amphiura filiformis TaxID=82378 RepID=UPI003B21B844